MQHIIIGAGPAGVVAAETLRKADPQAVITIIGDEPDCGMGIGLSAGVAQYRPAESLDSWLDRADRALYRSKEAGRGRATAA